MKTFDCNCPICGEPLEIEETELVPVQGSTELELIECPACEEPVQPFMDDAFLRLKLTSEARELLQSADEEDEDEEDEVPEEMA